MSDTKKKKSGQKAAYVKLASLSDLCRLACGFDYSTEMLILSKFKGENRLMLPGERIENNLILYYVNVKDNVNIVKYMPQSETHEEEVSFANEIEPSEITGQHGVYYIHVLHVDLSRIDECKTIEEKKINLLKTGGIIDIIKGSIRDIEKNEKVGHVYSFQYKGNTIVGAFNILEEFCDDKDNFYYAVEKKGTKNAFIRYDYKTDNAEFTDKLDEHTYIYIKLINLAEPFPFFKM